MNAELDKIFSGYRSRRVAVIGAGVSNMPLIRLLTSYGITVTVCDMQEMSALGANAEELRHLGAELHCGASYLDELDYDIIFRTPGLLPTNVRLREASERRAFITSEMELFFEVCPCNIIAVTGSDGKTTTTTLISELLKAEGKTVYLGGNIGHPLLADSVNMSEDDYAVVELSSFQLMDMKRSAPVAVVTNITPNHLDKHTDMEEYTEAKKQVFRRQSSDGVVVLNYDNALTRSCADEAAGRVRYFSRLEKLSDGVCLSDGYICVDGRPILNRDEIVIPGEHNVENYMAAIAAVYGIVSEDAIRQVARSFHGVEHRLELVRELNGVKFYNDSIGTSPTRTIAGLRSFDKKPILIAGGYDKHILFDELGSEIVRRVKALYLTGATSEAIDTAVKNAGEVETHIFEGFKDAVCAAAKRAENGDLVLLSPACAAFDRFKNFEERGRYFKDIVNSL